MNRFTLLRYGRIAALAVIALVVGLLIPHASHAAPMAMMGLGSMMGMIIDAQTQLSSAQALTVTAVSTNVYDQSAAGNFIAPGEPMAVVFTVSVAADHTTGDETYQFEIIQSAVNDLSSPDIIVQTDATFFGYAQLTKGARVCIPIPPDLITKRYLGVNYVLGGTTPSVTLSAEIIPLSFLQNEQVFPKNYTNSA